MSVGKSLLRLNFNYISPSNCFRLDLKITSLVFLTLSEILSAFHHYNRFFKSKFASFLSFLIEICLNITNYNHQQSDVLYKILLLD